MSAIISPSGRYRYRLERDVQDEGVVIAYFGINPSTADATVDDHTVRKWTGFTRANGGRRFIVGNVFAYRAVDVRTLAEVLDPSGPDNLMHLSDIVREADILVPCWGSTNKVPSRLHAAFPHMEQLLRSTGQPLWVFGFTKDGDPLHPLMLPYSTPLQFWKP